MAGDRRIGILTGGGDCPGLNAAIRAVVKGAAAREWECLGILDGFEGMVEQRSIPLSYDRVSGIIQEGGTILGSSNTANPFAWPEGPRRLDRSKVALAFLRRERVRALVVIGGDGTLRIAGGFHRLGFPVVVIPKTIDNDVPGTELAVGFSSAVATAARAVDMLRSTARSHHRTMVIETMGREAGWLALAAGMASGSDVIVLPEFPYRVSEAASAIRDRLRRGRSYTLVVIAEGARTVRGEPGPGGGSAGSFLAARLSAIGECRLTVLGHLQRSGPPDVPDRLLATALGLAALRSVASGKTGVLLAPGGRGIRRVPLERVPHEPRLVPRNHPLVLQARTLGITIPGGVEPR